MRYFLSDCFYAVFGDNHKQHIKIALWLLVAAQFTLLLVSLLIESDDDHNGGRKRKLAPPRFPSGEPLPVPNFSRDFLETAGRR